MRHEQWINLCLRLAKRNTKALPYRYAGVLVKGGRVISIGFNRIKNNDLGNPRYLMRTTHCEVDTLRNVNPRFVNGSILYVVGLTKADNFVYARPCAACTRELVLYFNLGLRAVYYLTPSGIQTIHRDQNAVAASSGF